MCTILKAAPDLMHCVLHLDYDETATTIPMSCLRRLCINEPSPLFHLAAPFLEDLYIVSNPALAEVPRFVHRSSCLLTTLILMDCHISSDLFDILRDLRSVTYLLVEDRKKAAVDLADLFKAMTITGTTRDMCPNLTSLVLGPASNLHCNVFYTMAQSRFQPGHPHAPLKRLRLFRARDPTAGWTKLEAQVQELRNEGRDVDTMDPDEAHMLKSKVYAFDTISA
ncbi:hypothetical protein DFH06DRAFT_1139317 [Mycena polygramma]|nr:hypothetical protein DFH06DRAFT_1139317 [Mycena polygramma]